MLMFHRSLRGKALTVLVGGEKTIFTIHEDLAIAHSDYFAKASAGTWTESITGVYHLQDEIPQAFELFARWLYTGTILVNDDGDLDRLLIHAWACGDRLQATSFKNTIMTLLYKDWRSIRERGNYPRIEVANLAYAVSTPQCTLRKLVIDKFSSHLRDDHVTAEVLSLVSSELKDDLLTAMAAKFEALHQPISREQALTTLRRLEYDVCDRYHQHENDGPPCTPVSCASSYNLLPASDVTGASPHPFERICVTRVAAAEGPKSS
jgi:hypothetical protein